MPQPAQARGQPEDLLLAAGMAVVPASSIVPGAAIATCFAPEEDCAAFAVDAVNGAGREILVSAYSLTIGSGIPEALARAAQRGVNVRLIADKTTPCERKAGVDLLVSAGASVWIDRGVRIAHSKTMVIDGKVTLTWSGATSAGSADRWPSSTPCASDACGSGSMILN